jgi:hypothetical protein
VKLFISTDFRLPSHFPGYLLSFTLGIDNIFTPDTSYSLGRGSCKSTITKIKVIVLFLMQSPEEFQRIFVFSKASALPSVFIALSKVNNPLAGYRVILSMFMKGRSRLLEDEIPIYWVL